MIARLFDRADAWWLRVPSWLRDGVTVGVVVLVAYVAVVVTAILS